ncbi:Metallo-dependent hydrolase [Patellaria atrata CBS 101060]|uniref:Metallo-dependent hydrolase n=1 Tax=Patellaria atrata CBS 101060 TaxID=1346257 RepID=A0A9P4VN46_9PEZI|nr:Metallo-dependent hydrolase [Patellaria atrata CBS 101060]
MVLEHLEGARIAAPADFHVHLRDRAMMELVTPTIRKGGVNTVYVMPNLNPPITTVEQALAYRVRLQSLAPDITFLMTLFLHATTTPSTIIAAAAAGIVGIKSYPANVTTQSSAGVTDYTSFFPVFAEMERQGLVLNLHGECPSGGAITVLNAEEKFLPTLHLLHATFPRLRIVLEHCSTAAAVAAVRECGPTVAGTVTPHHLSLVVDDWAADSICFCKPVAKTPRDRDALLRTAVSGSPKFFLGSDSAPHPLVAKTARRVAAGVFTQPYVVPLVLDALGEACERGVVGEEEI